MPRESGSTGATATTSAAQGRFTVQLSSETGKELDTIGERMGEAVFKAAGVRVELSRPDVIRSLVATAKAVQAEQDAETGGDKSGA